MQEEKKKNKKHREIYIVLLLILCISIGFSYLSAKMDIGGNTTVKKQSWDVHFANLVETNSTIPESGSNASDLGSATITAGKTTEVTFDSTLSVPGDYYEFTVDVVNSGSINAMLDSSITNTVLTDEQKKYLTYSVTYNDGTEIKENDGIHAGKSVKIKVRVEFKKDISDSDLPKTEDIQFSSAYSMNYVQATSSASFKTSLQTGGITGGEIPDDEEEEVTP